MNRSQQGFTLVELLVAVVIFSVGLLALASSSAVMMRTLGESQSKTVAAAVAESRFERIRSTACANRTGSVNDSQGLAAKYTDCASLRSASPESRTNPLGSRSCAR